MGLKGMRFSNPKRGSCYMALVTAALALTSIAKKTGIWRTTDILPAQTASLGGSKSLEHPDLKSLSCTSGQQGLSSPLGFPSARGVTFPAARPPCRSECGMPQEHGLWPRKGEGAGETNCACPESNTNTAMLHSQHTRQKISVLSEGLFLYSVSAVNKHSWWELCQRCRWKVSDQTPWSHFQTPLHSFFF